MHINKNSERITGDFLKTIVHIQQNNQAIINFPQHKKTENFSNFIYLSESRKYVGYSYSK